MRIDYECPFCGKVYPPQKWESHSKYLDDWHKERPSIDKYRTSNDKRVRCPSCNKNFTVRELITVGGLAKRS